MNTPKEPFPSLAEVEREVIAESREWGRKRLEERLQELADQQGEVSPLGQRKHRKLTLRSELGSPSLRVDYGLDRPTGQWLSPVPRAWGMGPHQKLTPGFAEKLCFTVTATGCHEDAAQVVSKWSGKMDDSTLHRLVQRMGEQAGKQRAECSKRPPAEREPQRQARAWRC